MESEPEFAFIGRKLRFFKISEMCNDHELAWRLSFKVECTSCQHARFHNSEEQLKSKITSILNDAACSVIFLDIYVSFKISVHRHKGRRTTLTCGLWSQCHAIKFLLHRYIDELCADLLSKVYTSSTNSL